MPEGTNTPESYDIETDVTIIGAGVAGLAAGVRALEFDVDVTVLEKGDKVGGTGLTSGGWIAVDKSGEPNSGIFEPIEESVEWLDEIDAPTNILGERWAPLTEEHDNVPVQVEPVDYAYHMRDLIEDGGGTILLETPMDELLMDDEGTVTGVKAKDPSGDPLYIRSGSVILATGGIIGNDELVRTFLPSDASILLRGNQWKTGDGFIEARKIGAKTTEGMSIPSGHTTLGPPAKYGFMDLRPASMFFATKSIAVGMDGKRFTDEGQFNLEDEQFIDDMIYEADGEAFLVIDHDLYTTTWPHQRVETKIENAKKWGAEVVEAETIPELCDGLDEFGVDGETAQETIEEFNAHVSDGNGEKLKPPRTNYQTPMDTPPFYAVGVQAGVEMVFGGLDVSEEGQVLSRAESMSTNVHYEPDTVRLIPIEGLYAAGLDAGRSGHGYYRAGWGFSLSTGRVTGKQAALNAKQ